MKTINKILIVNDNAEIRHLVHDILCADYNILEATDYDTALDLITKYFNEISCVFLDLDMSGRQAFNLCKKLKENDALNKIPVIVSTENESSQIEIDALTFGVWDFIKKPIDANLLKVRVKNVVLRNQFSALSQLRFLAEFDTLTGIYNKNKFMDESEKLIKSYTDKNIVLIRFDINQFNLVNSFFGVREGDNLLKYIATCIKQLVAGYERCVYGRIEADIFGICLPFNEREELFCLVEQSIKLFKNFNKLYDIVPCFGLYVVTDRSLPINIMFDHAALAAKNCKGNYFTCYSFYNEEMRRAIEKEQQITNEMNYALEHNQFDVYIQPKYNIRTNTPAGGEALVRWIHPEKGVISPGDFIPIFEKNGFIVKLDAFVWEKVCKLIKSWLDADIKPHPISVNISRVNLYNPNFVETLTKLVDNYNVPHSLFHLELTESAYTDNPVVMKSAISRLQNEGFVVLMDDFGSGYSSLNMLKEIPVDILKIDMRFFSDVDETNRGQNIVASVIRLSKWLNIPAIAEGVETAEQVRFLREIGCEYVQGYYYARPMTVEQYSAYVSSNTVFHGKSEINSEHTEMLLVNSDMEIVFSNMFLPMAFFEYKDRNLEIIRVNDAYFDLFNYDMLSGFSFSKTKKMILPEYMEKILDAFDNAVANKKAVDCEYRRYGVGSEKEERWISLKLKYLDTIAGKHVLMGSFADITAQKKIDSELQKYRTVIKEDSEMTNKMLIVDDSEVNREYLKLIFSKMFVTYEASNGKEALEALNNLDNKVDIIMLDVNMPIMDGYEFLKYKNDNKNLAHIPVIIISADDDPQQQSKVLAMGANDYIVKPFVEDVVIRRVNNVIESDHRFKDILKKYNTPVRNSKKDLLTGICNSATAEKLIDNIMTINENIHCLIILDVDDLCAVNDEFGREAGDNVLIQLSNMMKTFFRASDIIARLGDDEICIFMNSISSAVSIDEKCKHIQESIGAMKYKGVDKPVTCCIGAALSESGDTFKQLYFRAKQALIQAQNTGKGISIIADRNKNE